jgi:hypothetical protein
MKKVLVVLVLLAVAAGAYAVSGKIFARFNSQGPVFEYWFGGGNNVDLWQQKDGTGFELGFDSFALLYKARPAIAIPFGLDANGAYDENGWGRALTASSPGYFKIKDIKIGDFAMQIGASWHQVFANRYTLSTNTNGTTNNDVKTSTTFNKFYIDYKFDLPLGDMITIKQYDWDLMHFEIAMGDTMTGNNASLSNKPNNGSSFLAYVPLNVLISLDPVALTLSPLLVYEMSTVVQSPVGATNTVDISKMKVGGYARANVAIADFLSLYVMGGGFLTTASTFDKDVAGTVTTTNTDSKSTSIALPVFAGIVLALGPGVKMTLGWGIQYTTTTTITPGATNTMTGMINRYGAYDGNVRAEYAIYGDNMMDLAFLRFGSDAKFAGNWSVGIAGAVGLNDEWTYTWYMKGQTGDNVTGIGSGTVIASGANQLLSFLNFMNYDRQMYIKYEDENVAIKGTISQLGNANSYNADNLAGGTFLAVYDSLFGMFEYVDITIKF